jgi:hypothetical protein
MLLDSKTPSSAAPPERSTARSPGHSRARASMSSSPAATLHRCSAWPEKISDPGGQERKEERSDDHTHDRNA